MPLALTARYVFPVAGPPIERGVVTIEGERIVAVGRTAPQGAQVVQLDDEFNADGGVAILPGLVNAHTHLEFSYLKRPLGEPGMPLPDWIRAVIEHRREREANEGHDNPLLQSAIDAGAADCLATGTTTMADIFHSRRPHPRYKKLSADCLRFHEFLGLMQPDIDEQLKIAKYHLRAGEALHLSDHIGLSPHAPYSTHRELVRSLCDMAKEHRLPVAMHLAESREELELLRRHEGPFRAMLEELGIWNADAIPRETGPFDYLHLLAEADPALVIHGNYLAEDEVDFIGEHAANMAVVYCPRTHAYFQHEPYPLHKMLAAGGNVALGTDSRASNPDLSLLAEMQHAAEHHGDVAPDKILRMGTINGARALGLDGDRGTLQEGKRADLAVVALPSGNPHHPYKFLFEPRCKAVATYVAGERVV